jgi:LPXTG-motif cell wall-anchored protein
VTAQAVTALRGKPFPLTPVKRRSTKSGASKAGAREHHAARKRERLPDDSAGRQARRPAPAGRSRIDAENAALVDRTADNGAPRASEGEHVPAIWIAIGGGIVLCAALWLGRRRRQKQARQRA